MLKSLRKHSFLIEDVEEGFEVLPATLHTIQPRSEAVLHHCRESNDERKVCGHEAKFPKSEFAMSDPPQAARAHAPTRDVDTEIVSQF